MDLSAVSGENWEPLIMLWVKAPHYTVLFMGIGCFN